MRAIRRLASGAAAVVFSLAWPAIPVRASGAQPQEPPPAPPVATRAGAERLVSAPIALATTTPVLYSIGDPTAEEQLYVELINRARANPPAESQRLRGSTDGEVLTSINFFHVDLDLMVTQFVAIAAVPPLSLNSKLTAAARLHTKDMFDNQFQEHKGTDGSTFLSRVSGQGYNWSNAGENVFSFADSVEEGHAGFEIDWGSGPTAVGGMQNPPGHRNSIHNASFREIGVGVIDGTNGSVGPQLVTQDFASPAGASSPFITGVAYYDLNGDKFYGLGKGIGGVKVEVKGASFYAVTANSGGYSVPVPGDGTYEVTFSSPGIPTFQQSVTVTNGQNVKFDFSPSYAPPTLSGPAQVELNATNRYQFSLVGGASSYQAKIAKLIPGDLLEGAEGNSSGITLVVSTNYPSIDSSAKFSGTNSFLLSHPASDGRPPDQFIILNPVFWPATNSLLSFQSLITFSAPSQIAVVQGSIDGGVTWSNLWAAPGDGTAGTNAFNKQSLSLSNYISSELSLRFGYLYKGGGYFPATAGAVGWHIDDITLSHIRQVMQAATNDLTTNFFSLAVHDEGNYLLSVRPKLSDHFLAWGPSQEITAALGPVNIHLGGISRATGEVRIPFSVINIRTTTGFDLQTSADLTNWTTISATLTNKSGGALIMTGTSFEFDVGSRLPRAFYRIKSK